MAIHDFSKKPFDLSAISDEGDEGDEGATGKGGSGAPLIDPSLFGDTNHFLLELLRLEEAKIGKGVPITIDPNERKNRQANQYGQGPKAHPLLNSQKFDGIANNKDDPRVSTNEKARENLENRLENRLTNKPAPRTAPTPRPPGG